MHSRALKRKAVLGLIFFMAMILGAPAADAAAVRMRVVVVNPSKDKKQTTQVKSYLPKEIAMKDILETGGLEVEYDQEQGVFFVYKDDVELEPGETKSFEIVLDDVWLVPDDKLMEIRDRADKIEGLLKDTSYAETAALIIETIRKRVDEIQISQADQNITRQQHIAVYRQNLKTLDAIEEDFEKLEKALVTVGGPPNPELIEESDINLKAPSSKTTWILIFVVMIFVAILSATFYFTWHRQAKITENIFSREKDDSFSDFKPGEQPPAESKGPGG